MAVMTGLEPATSAVTGQHSNRLSYITVKVSVVGLEPTTSPARGERATKLRYTLEVAG